MISRLIYFLGELKYNNKIKNKYKWLKKTEKWSLKELEDFQTERLKDLLDHAYKNSPYYKLKFDDYGVKPSDLRTLEDLKKFPVLMKSELREKTDEISVKKVISEKLYYSETSGSTGEPLVFYRNQDWDAIHRASIQRGYSWHGVKPYEKSGYFWGYNLEKSKNVKVRFLDFLQNRYRIFTYNDENLDYFLKKMENAKYIEGYSSMIYEVAKKINESHDKYRFPKMKMIKGTSEKIFDSYKEEVKKAFNLNFVSEYGSAEAGIIAFECKYGNMHVTMENVIVEIEDDEIIVTNLSSTSYPIIRYRLGDYVELESNAYNCGCGMKHPIIKSVLGRVGHKILGKESSYPSLTLYYVFKNLAIKNILLYYQAIQEKQGELILNIEQELDSESEASLRVELLKYFNNDINFTINDNVVLDREGGKMRDFISRIN